MTSLTISPSCWSSTLTSVYKTKILHK